jgi:hypothetical protein
MADHQYPCPKCAAVLQPPKALNPGQRVKCPKCQNIFVPVPEKPAEEDAATYGMVAETEEEKKEEVQVKRRSLEAVKDKRPKSARGPAVAICTGPGNKMLFAASFTCVSCIFSIIVLLWPMFFSKRVLDDKPDRWLIIGCAVFAFVYNGFVAYGAFHMLRIDSYRWAIMAAIMDIFPLQFALAYASFNWLARLVDVAAEGAGIMVAIVLGVIYLLIGGICFKTLRKKEVVAGFAERK